MSKLGTAIRTARLQRDLKLPALARRLGYSIRRSAKGARRIEELERVGLEEPSFVAQVAAELGISAPTVHRLLAEDERQRQHDWDEWAAQPIRPFVVVRYASTSFGHIYREVPADRCDRARAADFAGDLAQLESKRLSREVLVWLVISRRELIQFGSDGSVRQRRNVGYGDPVPLPCLRFRGRPFVISAR